MPIFPQKDLATDPNAKVLVFIDGQNLYKTCQRLFGHPHCHPHLLAEYLAGPRTNNRVGCRFYTGRPGQNIDPRGRSHIDRRLAVMSGVGVSPVTRDLRYHWDWGHRLPLPDATPTAQPQTVVLKPWQRPQEKGIDLLIGLDVVEFSATGVCDVAIIVSLDRDLYEIPSAIRRMRDVIRRPVRLEAAVPVEAGRKFPKILPEFSMTHQITPAIFDLCIDRTDYAASADQWVMPNVPRNLDEARAAQQATAETLPNSSN